MVNCWSAGMVNWWRKLLFAPWKKIAASRTSSRVGNLVIFMKVTKSAPRIRLLEMKFRLSQFLFLVFLAAMLLGVNGCMTEDPENNSARPWNSPQGWEGGMPMMDQQRH